MKDLQELIRIVSIRSSSRKKTRPDKPDKQKIFIPSEPLQVSEAELFEGVRSGKFETDKQAAWETFQSTAGDTRYQKLKLSLKTRLLAVLPTLRIKHTSEFARAEHEALLLYTEAMILLRLGARELGTRLLEKAALTAERYELTDMEIACLKLLQGSYCKAGDKKKYHQSLKRVQRLCDVERIEREYQVVYDGLCIEYATATGHKGEREALKSKAEQALATTGPGGPYSSRLMQELRTSIYCLCAQIEGNYPAAILHAREFLHYCAMHPDFSTPLLLGKFHLICAEACFHMQRLTEAKSHCQSAMARLPEGGENYRAALVVLFLVQMHKKDYSGAVLTFKGSRRMRSQDVGFPRELWKIFHGYLHYCAMTGLLPARSVPPGGNWRAVLQSIDVLEQDKSGAYWSVLVLKAVSLVEGGKLDAFRELKGAIRNYRHRYLAGRPGCERSNLFAKLMLELMELMGDRHDWADMKQTTQTFEELQKCPVLDSLEVLPYELLWDRMLA